MNNPHHDESRRTVRSEPAQLARLPAAILDMLCSQRGLALLFLSVAAFLTLSGWVRPPLSSDIRGPYLALGLWPGTSETDVLLSGPRPWRLDSIGVGLLATIVLAALVVLFRPHHLGHAAGLLLAAALAGNAAAAFNHPLLVQAMDGEFEQRQQMARALASVAEDAMPNATNGRLGMVGFPTGDEQPGDLGRGMLYLLYGRWLVIWAVVGILCAAAGPLPHRLRLAGVWLAVGAILSGAVCGRRLQAEYHWHQALRLEGDARHAEAQHQVRCAVAVFPAFDRLERTWLLTGKLDYLTGRSTPQERYFRAFQLNRDKLRVRGVAYQQDLPWVIPGARDYRLGLVSSPSQFNNLIAIGDGKSGTPSFRKGWSSAPRYSDGATGEDRGPQVQGQQEESERAYRFARTREVWLAIGLLEDLSQENGADQLARQQLARLWTHQGLRFFQRSSARNEEDWDLKYFWRDTSLTAAQTAWSAAAEQDPDRRDSAFFRGLVQSRMVPDNPKQLEALFAQAQGNLADRILLAEMLNVLGDSYFEAGDFSLARLCYARSFDVFCLPKVINIRAQERLGGR